MVGERRREGIEGVFKAQAIALPLPPSFHDALRVPRADRAAIADIRRRAPERGDHAWDIDIADMVRSPLYSRQAQQDAITAIAGPMGLAPLTANTLALMASKRRLFVLPQLIRALRDLIADEKGEVTAEITAAAPLSKSQASRLAKTLEAKVGRNVKINTTVDETLIGGLVVKVGSRMIDTSVAAKLANLQQAMKEVG